MPTSTEEPATFTGAATIDDHRLQVFADRLTPLGPGLVPTGEIADAAGPTDWREARPVAGAEIDVMWGCMDESVVGIAAALHVAYGSAATRYLDLDGSFELAADPAETHRLLTLGAEKAEAIASDVLARAKANIGLL